MNTASAHESAAFELRFQHLFNEGRAYAFPCDAEGHVDMDRLGDKLRLNYLFARGLVGRDFAVPVVTPTLH
jgi:hypothetical protein